MSTRDYFGAGASFPKAVQWHVWVGHHASVLGTLQPVERFIIDATMVLQQLHIRIARELRKTREEDMTIADAVAEKVAWFNRNRPKLSDAADSHPELKLVLEAVSGAYLVTERLAKEIDLAIRRGYVLVDTGAENRELGTQEQAVLRAL